MKTSSKVHWWVLLLVGLCPIFTPAQIAVENASLFDFKKPKPHFCAETGAAEGAGFPALAKHARLRKQMAVSPLSTWVGAQLTYSFDGKASSDNIIGAARIKIATVEQFIPNPRFDLLVIGNFSRVTSLVSANPNEDLKEITQSAQGLSMGIAPIFKLNPFNPRQNYFRAWVSANYKLNGFQLKNQEEEVINLHQFRTAVGLEFEGLKIENGGSFLLGVECSYSSFSEDVYYQIFERTASKILALETTLVIPMPGNLGLMGSVIVSDFNKPVFQGGFVVKY